MFNNKIKILDGGIASTLQDNGHDVEVDPLWSARLLKTNPQTIFDVHTQFLTAGAEIITTASYQASIEGFQKYLHIGREESVQLIKESVFIAKKSVEAYKDESSTKIIAGSVSPYGAYIGDGSEYTGLYIDSMTEDEVINSHKPLIDTLVDAGVDLIALETFPSLKEAITVIKLLKKYPIKFWLSFSCKDGSHTNYGDEFGYAFKHVFETGGNQVVAIGINCTNPSFVTSLLKLAAEHVPLSEVPRIVYPNLGEKWSPELGWDKNTSTLQFNEALLREWIDLGVKVIGGCCRVTPQMINKISDIIRNKF